MSRKFLATLLLGSGGLLCISAFLLGNAWLLALALAGIDAREGMEHVSGSTRAGLEKSAAALQIGIHPRTGPM
ncbi:hypothetical protein [Pseudomonas sp. BN417]|uniref:hypothetical protein n=1 Tax=Pseudomonas sp. BN417 TaxID=2567890 RepID=UPI0024537E18|nr:hypothetical protein [Pseudomonas sp. BN417]